MLRLCCRWKALLASVAQAAAIASHNETLAPQAGQIGKHADCCSVDVLMLPEASFTLPIRHVLGRWHLHHTLLYEGILSGQNEKATSESFRQSFTWSHQERLQAQHLPMGKPL